MDPKQLRLIIREEVTDIVQTQLEPVKKDIRGLQEGVSVIGQDVDSLKKDVKELREDTDVLKKDVKEMSENVDAARADIENLHMDVKGIREKEGMAHSRNKREIDEIKTHLNLPLMPDTPEV